MSVFQQVVINRAAPLAGRLFAAPQQPLFLRIIAPFLAGITAVHFNPKTFYEKYDRKMVEEMSERGGW